MSFASKGGGSMSRGQAAKAPRSGLGTTTGFVAGDDQGEALRLRYRLVDQARRLLPENKRLAACMRVARVGAAYVKVMWDSSRGSASFRNVCRCADGKLCAICAAQLGEAKRAELAGGTSAVQLAGALFMMTITTSHQLTDDLADVMTRFDEAKRKMRQARAYRAALDAWGGGKNVKFVTAWELTWSPLNGWHYHQHVLVFVLDREQMSITAEAFAEVARAAWKDAAAKMGLTMNEHGFDWTATAGAIADYIAKWGHEPTRRPWGSEDELTKAHSKSGRVVTSGVKKTIHVTPMQMLRLMDEGITQLFGHDLGDLFRSYAAAVRGKPQLKWSPGLRAALGLQVEKSDTEIVEEQNETSACHGLLSRDDWAALVGNDARVDLLDQVRAGRSWEEVATWLAAMGIRYLPPLPETDEG